MKKTSRKSKRAALFDPYLDTLGGGERHILSILKVLEDEGFELSLFWDEKFNRQIESRFNFDFKNLHFAENIFRNGSSQIKKLQALSRYDIFFYVTDGSYFVSTASKNFAFVMVPKRSLIDLTLIDKLKLLNWRFIVNSRFTQNFLNKWNVKSEVIYPYIDDNFLDSPIAKKEKIILSVGRFFTHLHAKKHDELIKIFKKHEKEFPGFKLVLAGGLTKENEGYFSELKALIRNEGSIELAPNLSYTELFSLYKKALIYWHFAGFGVDEKSDPHLVEHFGITPLEAMATGCITFVYNAGGPKEVIQNKITGFLFNSEEELIRLTKNVIHDNHLQENIRENAKEFVKNNFSYGVFKEKVRRIIL